MRRPGIVALSAALAAGLAWADARPAFTRSTQTEVMPSTALFDLPTPFLGWAARDDLGLIGAEGLYSELGGLKAKRPCGDVLRDTANAGSTELYALLSADGHVCVYEGVDGPALIDVRARATAISLGIVDLVDAGGATSKTAVLVETRGSSAVALDARTGARRWTRDPDLGALTSAASSDAGGFFVVGGERGAAVLYGQTGRLVRAVTTARRGVPDPVYAVAVDRDGKRLLTGQGGGRVTMWSLETGRSIRTVDFGDGDVVDVSWALDGTQITAVSRIAGEGGGRLEFEVWDLVDDAPGFRESVPAPAEGEPASGLAPRPKLRLAPWGVTLTGSDGVGFNRVWQRPGRFNMPRSEPVRELPHHRQARGPTTPVKLSTVSDAVGDTLSVTSLWPAPSGRSRLAADALGNSVWVDDATRRDLAVYGPEGKVRVRHALAQPAHSATIVGDRLMVVAEDGSVRATAKAGAALALIKDLKEATVAATGTTPGVVWGSRTGDVTFTGGGAAPRIYTVHSGPVVAIASSPDGQRAVSVGPRVPDPASNDPVPTLSVGLLLRDPSSRGQISSSILGGSEGFTWVVDGTTATVSLRGEEALVRTDLETVVLDLKNGGRRLTLPLTARDAAFGPGESIRWIDSNGHGRTVAIAAVANVERLRGRTLCASRDNGQIATVDADVLTLWNGFEAREGRSFAPTGTPIVGCRFNDDGKQIAFLQSDGRFETWSVFAAVALAGVSGQAAVNPWFDFGPILDEADPPPVRAVSGTKKDLAEEIVYHGQLLTDVVGPGAVWVRKDATHLTQLELGQGTVVETIEIPAGVAQIESHDGRFATLLDGSGEPVGFVDLAPGTTVGRRLWDADTRPIAGHRSTYVWVKDNSLVIGPPGGPAEATPLPGSNPVAAAMIRDGRVLAVADDLNRVALISLPFREAHLLPAGIAPGEPNASPLQEQLWFSGEQVFGRDASGQVRTWSWMSNAGGNLAIRAPGAVKPVGDVHTLVASPDGRTLYSGQGDNLVRSWDIDKAIQRTAFIGPVGPVHALAASADGRWIAAGSTDGTVRVFDVVTKVDDHSFVTFGESTEALALGQDGAGGRIASLSDRGVLRVWDLATGHPLVHWTVTPFSGVGALQWLPGLARLSVSIGGLDWRVGLDEDSAAGGEPAQVEPAPAFLGSSSVWVRLRSGRLASADPLGHILLWDEASELPYARLTMLDDGGWISDRLDGVQVASESLRDGSSPLLYNHGGAIAPNTKARVDALVYATVLDQKPAIQECLALAPGAAPGANIELTWVMSAGSVQRLEVVSDTTGSDALAGCVVGTLQAMRFDLEIEGRNLRASWGVAGSDAVRVLGLADEDRQTVPAVEAALTGALAKVPGACVQKGAKGDARMQWRVDDGRVKDVKLLDGSTIPAPVGECLVKAAMGVRVEGVERASGVWVVTR